jgi:hypothetical protein
MPSPHPGQIVFVIDGHESIREAASVPDSIRFARTPVGLVAVVRIVVAQAGQHRSIHSYDENGVLVSTATQPARSV